LDKMKKKIIISSFLITLIIIGIIPQVLAEETYFSSDFSDATFSDWSGDYDAERITNPVPTGSTYACNATSSGFGLSKQWTPVITKGKLSFKVRWENLTIPYGVGTPTTIGKIYGSGSSEYIYVCVGKSGSKTVFALYSEEIAEWAYGITALTSDTWYNVILEFSISATAILTLEVNKRLETSIIGDNSDGSLFDYLEFSSGGMGNPNCYDRQYLADVNVYSIEEDLWWWLKYVLLLIVIITIISFAVYIKGGRR